jgi:predicted O-methyltransferase YrrM
MYSKLQLATKYLKYYLTASNGKGHGIHSPFVFDFITKVLNDEREFYAYKSVSQLKSRLETDGEIVEVQDFGAGSVAGNYKQRSISSIAKNAAKPGKYGRLLFRIASYYKPSVTIELGTSLGLSAAYLAMGNTNGKVITCEGAPAIAAMAKKNFQSLDITNINVVEGNFDETLPVLLQHTPQVDLAFVDGNHRKAPTLRYFEQLLGKAHPQSIFIFDDIHWSEDMEAAWEDIKNHPRVMLTIDLFFIGLVFFRTDFKVKQHFVIRF